MREGARRVVFATLLLVAVIGAVGLMASSLVVDPSGRTWLQVVSAGAAIGCGITCTILAWRWWSGALTGDRRGS